MTPEPYLQSSPVICSPHQLPVRLDITCVARQSPAEPARYSELVTREIAPPETPAVPTCQSLAVVRTEAKIPVPPGRPFRYCRQSRPDPKTHGLDAWEHWLHLMSFLVLLLPTVYRGQLLAFLSAVLQQLR